MRVVVYLTVRSQQEHLQENLRLFRQTDASELPSYDSPRGQLTLPHSAFLSQFRYVTTPLCCRLLVLLPRLRAYERL